MRLFALASLLTLVAACGHSQRRVETVVVQGETQRYVSHVVLSAYQPAPVVVTPPAPAPARPPAPPEAEAPASAPVTCSGDERIRIVNRRVDGGSGPAVVASGSCVVEIAESILVGEPALVVTGNARAVVVESRVLGRIVTDGAAQLDMRGSTHEPPRS
jgi:hypothetical protein